MKHRMRELLNVALAVAPLMLAGQGCYSSNEGGKGPGQDVGEVTGEAGDADDNDSQDGNGKRPAELELCEKCQGPAPASPDILCADGSTEGFVCAKKDLGDCGWLYRACPDSVPDSDDDGTLCGGLAGKDCAKGEYCQTDASCGAADQAGKCTPKPGGCQKIYLPVCGCDGKTYGNACEAASNGISVASKGTCAGGGSSDFCGGIAGIACPKGEYCQYDSSCGFADQGGLCTTVPEFCTDLYSPVCGCNGKTYGNNCEAASQGVSVARQGTCDTHMPCSSCQDPAPLAPNYECHDGSIGGPACVFQKEAGKCGWVILECPISRDPCQGFECKPGYHCTAPADAPSCVRDEVLDCHSNVPPKDGTCWRDGDCAKGKECIGASCCPINAVCIIADKPGVCK